MEENHRLSMYTYSVHALNTENVYEKNGKILGLSVDCVFPRFPVATVHWNTIDADTVA